jgi:hypothetical protein
MPMTTRWRRDLTLVDTLGLRDESFHAIGVVSSLTLKTCERGCSNAARVEMFTELPGNRALRSSMNDPAGYGCGSTWNGRLYLLRREEVNLSGGPNGARVAQEQVDTCKTLKHIILSDGSRHDQAARCRKRKFWEPAWEGFRESA